MATHNDKSYCKTQVEIMTTRNARKSHHLRETHTVFTHDNNGPQSRHFFFNILFFRNDRILFVYLFYFRFVVCVTDFLLSQFSPPFLVSPTAEKTSHFSSYNNKKENMDITTHTTKKNIKKLKNAAQKIKKIFDKQLPQMKPQILSCIKNDLPEIMKIIEEIENQLELIEVNQKLQITLFNEAIRNFNKINQTINAVTKDLQLLTTMTPQAIKRRKPKFWLRKHNPTHENNKSKSRKIYFSSIQKVLLNNLPKHIL